MAIIRPSQYPGRWNPVSADAPQGSGKNRTAPGSNDGSYFDQVWFNDMDSLNQALFIASGVSPNGTQDVGTASQIFDALINNRWSNIGNYSIGTIVTASNGKQYYCNQANGRDTSVVDPTTDTLDNWREYPYEEVVSSSGTAKKYWNGDLIQYGAVTTASPTGVTVTFPVPFVAPVLDILATSNDTLPRFSTWQNATSTSVFIQKWDSASGGTQVAGTSSWQATGKWV